MRTRAPLLYQTDSRLSLQPLSPRGTTSRWQGAEKFSYFPSAHFSHHIYSVFRLFSVLFSGDHSDDLPCTARRDVGGQPQRRAKRKPWQVLTCWDKWPVLLVVLKPLKNLSHIGSFIFFHSPFLLFSALYPISKWSLFFLVHLRSGCISGTHISTSSLHKANFTHDWTPFSTPQQRRTWRDSRKGRLLCVRTCISV